MTTTRPNGRLSMDDRLLLGLLCDICGQSGYSPEPAPYSALVDYLHEQGDEREGVVRELAAATMNSTGIKWEEGAVIPTVPPGLVLAEGTDWAVVTVEANVFVAAARPGSLLVPEDYTFTLATRRLAGKGYRGATMIATPLRAPGPQFELCRHSLLAVAFGFANPWGDRSRSTEHTWRCYCSRFIDGRLVPKPESSVCATCAEETAEAIALGEERERKAGQSAVKPLAVSARPTRKVAKADVGGQLMLFPQEKPTPVTSPRRRRPQELPQASAADVSRRLTLVLIGLVADTWSWDDPLAGLLGELAARCGPWHASAPSWPRTGDALADLLRQLEGDLLQGGVLVDFRQERGVPFVRVGPTPEVEAYFRSLEESDS